MSSLNKVMLIGHLGHDPSTRYMTNGDAVTNFSLATSESWKDKGSGERVEETEWHRIIMFRRLAEIAQEYLKKGAKVFIEGKLKTRKWTDKDGNEKYTTEIIAHEMKMLGSPQARDEAAPEQNKPTGKPATKPGEKAAAARKGKLPGDVQDMDDDIPF